MPSSRHAAGVPEGFEGLEGQRRCRILVTGLPPMGVIRIVAGNGLVSQKLQDKAIGESDVGELDWEWSGIKSKGSGWGTQGFEIDSPGTTHELLVVYPESQSQILYEVVWRRRVCADSCSVSPSRTTIQHEEKAICLQARISSHEMNTMRRKSNTTASMV